MKIEDDMKCDCMGCRGRVFLVRCSNCNKVIIEGHHDSWFIDESGVGHICIECVKNGANTWQGGEVVEEGV